MAQFGVDDQSPAVAAMAGNWPMIDALLGGTAAMRAAGETFLPKWPKESDDSYKARLGSATLFPAFLRTATVMATKPFARPMMIDEGTIPAKVRDLFGDVDMLGTDLQPFAADLMLQAMQYGLTGVLVDAPSVPGIRTVADEKKAGARPYFTVYPANTILGWKATRSAAGATLTQLRLLEEFSEPDGPWGEVTGPQVRVLTPGAWETWRKAASSKEWVKYEEGQTSIDVIPFQFFYGVRKGFGIAAPPLLDLAFLNVEHWQSSSDQQTILHVARVPILFAKGFKTGETITIGASSATVAEDAEADLRFVEHTGAAIEAGRQSILDLEDRMRQSGAELLVQQPVVKTATATRSDDEGNRSILQRIAEDFDESLANCINLMGLWLGEAINAKVELYKDFGSANLTEKSGDLLLRAAGAGHLSSQTTFEQLQRMDVVGANLNWEDEKLRLAQSPPKPAAPSPALREETQGAQ